eukprot:GGOE01004331.1.p1 GENE.GGOE01004331.1~~GGOE01004331.1.p1  ORF type:complete len:320 (-),score=68.21 GGOE01004331.1:213-1172(-)
MADDYMSDALLGNLPVPKVSRTVQQLRDRKHGPARQQPTKQLQEDRREEGLQAPIPQANRGFQLLARMGYQPGAGLGKAESGPSQVIPLVVKRDRQGLGSSTDSAGRHKAQRQQDNATSTEAYRQQLHVQLVAKKLRRDFRKYFAMCQELDEAAERTRSPYLDALALQRSLRVRQPGPCFGSIYERADGRKVYVARAQEGSRDARWLCAALPELRPVVWSRADLMVRVASLPESATLEPAAHDLVEQWCREQDGDMEQSVEFTDEDIRLAWPDLVRYLRDTHTVCVHCGAQYATSEELEALCPGPTEEAHDKCSALDDE